MEEIKNLCYKGTRILLGNGKRATIDKMISILKNAGFVEIHIPVIQYQELFENKVGPENGNMMFKFKDAGDRDICLAPEYTAVIQGLAKTLYKYKKDLKVFYVQECFRGEKPQAGRYRQFTQLGVEIINPSNNYIGDLMKLATCLISSSVTPSNAEWYREVFLKNLKIDAEATRGLDYYKEGKGFEISYEALGAQKQICGGGEYEGGIGFALGVDRLLLIK